VIISPQDSVRRHATTLADLGRIVWRRKWTAAAVMIVSTAAAACALHFETPVYQAEAVFAAPDGDAPADLLSDSLILEAAGRLDLQPRLAAWEHWLPLAPLTRAGALKRSVRIGQSSGAIHLRVDSADSRTAARFANVLVETLMEHDTIARRRASQDVVNTLRAQLAEIEAQLNRDTAALKADPARPDFLKDRVEATRRVYASILERVSQASLPQGSGIRLITAAQPPVEPYRPDVPAQLGYALAAGIVLAAGAALLREKADSRVRTPDDAAVAPVLGSVPRASAGKRSVDAPAVERITAEVKDAEASESFRVLLASILAASPDRGTRTLLITSPRAGEGKTTIAANLAIALAEIQHRVLLVDADVRRPRLHSIFEVANTSGLGDLLCANHAVLDLPAEQLVRKTGVPNLSLLSSGPGTDGIFNRLYSPGMSRLLARFREEFDHVIIDAPPALEVADARALARGADGVIVVLRANRSDKRDAAEVVRQFERDGAAVFGTVLNDWPASRKDYRYRRSHGYGSHPAESRLPFAGRAAPRDA